MSDNIKSAAYILLWLGGGFLGLYLLESVNKTPPEPVVSCHVQSIPYETEEVEDGNSPLGDTYIEISGRSGEIEICEDEKGVVVSEEIVTEPVNEVVRYGTYVEPVQYDYSSYFGSHRTGAWCWDGTYSSATGRGACSWHGGVREWVYY